LWKTGSSGREFVAARFHGLPRQFAAIWEIIGSVWFLILWDEKFVTTADILRDEK
jgi:hypothetical protein